MRTHDGEVAEGLYRITKPGYRVFTAKDLIKTGYPGAADGEIYALFEVEPDAIYAGRKWDGDELWKQIKIFAARRSYRQINIHNRRSPDPRVMSLQELLRAMR